MEACGLVLTRDGREVFQPVHNAALDPYREFRIPAEILSEAYDSGLTLILHSHPMGPATPSLADRVACERTGVPWVILGLPGGDLARVDPDGFKAPLLGRPYVYGLLDCWALVRDYYAQTLGIDLPDFPRPADPDHWDRDWFAELADEGGFRVVEEPRLHDLILMGIQAPFPNHLGIYLGDQVFLHHRVDRLSGRELYGGLWLKATRRFYRHKDLP
jgi:cell wall-associated NlpC family hydrolase